MIAMDPHNTPLPTPNAGMSRRRTGAPGEVPLHRLRPPGALPTAGDGVLDSVALASALAKDLVVFEAGEGVFGDRAVLAAAHSLIVESFDPLPVVSSPPALMEPAAAVGGTRTLFRNGSGDFHALPGAVLTVDQNAAPLVSRIGTHAAPWVDGVRGRI
jgi:hypothetical protein